MDGPYHGEDDEDQCLEVVRCSKGYVPSSISYWTLHAIRSLTCQTSFLKKRNPTSLPGKRLPNPAAAVVPLLHRSFSRGLLSSGYARVKIDTVRCFPALSTEAEATMKEARLNSESNFKLNDNRMLVTCSFSTDGFSSYTVSSTIGADTSFENGNAEDACTSSSTDGSSYAEWPENYGSTSSSAVSISTNHDPGAFWEDKKKDADFIEVEMMKERFAKLLLGEDMSGGSKGVSTALAISNAITNLSASIFGELWRLEPLSPERKSMWRREMDWLVSVADHIVELVPSWQKFADGSCFEIMIAKPRDDVHTNLPALRKLDAMLLDFLDSCMDTEFWYVEQGVNVSDDDDVQNSDLLLSHREEEKWWLPTPKVAGSGLSERARKRLLHQRESISQILKAAMAINSQVLSEMEVPDAYWDTLPKSAKNSLGENLYKQIGSDHFNPEAVLSSLNLSTEHCAVEVANRIEAAIHIWRSKKWRTKQTNKLTKNSEHSGKYSWGITKENGIDAEKRELLAGRAETLLLNLKQRFPGLRQSLLDMTKIQYNKDVGQSILESYSRVMESLAFNVIARIDDILFVDDMTKPVSANASQSDTTRLNPYSRGGFSMRISVGTPFATPLATPSLSSTPVTSPRGVPNSPSHPGGNGEATLKAWI